MTLQDLVNEADRLMVKFEAQAKDTIRPSDARVAAQAASDLHGIVTRWYGHERFAQ